MGEPLDYYEILQVHPRAEQEIIKRAYRTLSRSYHPDANPPEQRAWASDRMSQLNQAYAVLSNPEARRAYDANRTAGGGVSARPHQSGSPSVVGAVRTCHWHAQRPRVSICTVCGRSVCAECRRTDGMAVVCPDCQFGRREVDLSSEEASSERKAGRRVPPHSGVVAGFGELIAADGLKQVAFAVMHLAVGSLMLALWLRGLVVAVALRFPGNLHLVWALAIAATLLSLVAIAVGMIALRAFRRPGAAIAFSLGLSLLAFWAFQGLWARPYAQLADGAREEDRLEDAIVGYSFALWNVGGEEESLRQRLGLAYLDAFAGQIDPMGESGSSVLAVGALRHLTTCSDPAGLQDTLSRRQDHAVVADTDDRLVAVYLAARRLGGHGMASSRRWTQAVAILSPGPLEASAVARLPAVHRLVLGMAVYRLSEAVRFLPAEQLTRLNRRYQNWIWETVTRQESERRQQGRLEGEFRKISQSLLKENGTDLDAVARSAALRADLRAARDDLYRGPSGGRETQPALPPAPPANTAPSLPAEHGAPADPPQSPAATMPAEEQSQTEAPFVGNAVSGVYHRPDCKHLPADENRVDIWSTEHASSEGYRPCEHCRPHVGMEAVSTE